MTKRELARIRVFAKKFYENTDPYHDWRHIEAVRENALWLARDYPNVDKLLLEAACYLHDIGRVEKDEGHPYISAKMARPFLEKLGVEQAEVELVCEAVYHHGKEDILKVKSEEARLLFDADKIEILSVFGFWRVSFFLADQRKMDFYKAVEFLWKYARDVRENYLQTEKAKKLVDDEFVLLEKLVGKFKETDAR